MVPVCVCWYRGLLIVLAYGQIASGLVRFNRGICRLGCLQTRSGSSENMQRSYCEALDFRSHGTCIYLGRIFNRTTYQRTVDQNRANPTKRSAKENSILLAKIRHQKSNRTAN